MSREGWGLIAVALIMLVTGFLIGGTVGACTQERGERRQCDTRAVANGCAIRVLDSASGEVKTVWKDGKP